jgi:SAM-dependent methyltransferase
VTKPLPQFVIAAACEEDLTAYGDTFRGVGYTKSQEEAEERYALMLNLVREQTESVSVLDLGCGLAHMLDYIQRQPNRGNIRYSGLDISARYLAAAKTRHPHADLILMDVLESDETVPDYDYVILNGLFNYRGSLDEHTMLAYWRALTSVAFRHCRRGMGFNVMSKIVDWEREDLFHLPFDTMARFVGEHLSRHFVIRHDYQAYEYTTYVYRTPSQF